MSSFFIKIDNVTSSNTADTVQSKKVKFSKINIGVYIDSVVDMDPKLRYNQFGPCRNGEFGKGSKGWVQWHKLTSSTL